MNKGPRPRTGFPQPSDVPYRLIPLTQGKVAFVDAEDYEELSKFRWYAHRAANNRRKKYYASRHGRRRFIRMHRQVMHFPKSDVDHRNGNGLDNRKNNLRVATDSQNVSNRGLQSNNKSGLKGVCWSKAEGKWVAQGKAHGKQVFLGFYRTKEAAGCAYDVFALRMFKEFARPNFLVRSAA